MGYAARPKESLPVKVLNDCNFLLGESMLSQSDKFETESSSDSYSDDSLPAPFSSIN